MKDSIRIKLEKLAERHLEVSALLSESSVISKQEQFKKLSKEFAELEPVVAAYHQYLKAQQDYQEALSWAEDADPELRALGKEEIGPAQQRTEALTQQLQTLMLPKDENDERNIFLEIRAGTGGNEAAIFSGDLFRMYSKYAENQGWRVEVMSRHAGEQGGYKEIIARIEGKSVYAQLKFESGAHRVQRVPATESQGRIHTSACTVAIMAELDEITEIEINKSDLKVDTYRSSGAGGQHVNTTDSAIRITHLPSGLVVECQDERSQHKNRARAMSLLQSRLLAHSQAQQQQAQSSERRSLVGSGDRSERIRTYNFPQGRVTDHRINLTLYQLPDIMEGHLDEVIRSLINEHQADQLAALAE